MSLDDVEPAVLEQGAYGCELCLRSELLFRGSEVDSLDGVVQAWGPLGYPRLLDVGFSYLEVDPATFEEALETLDEPPFTCSRCDRHVHAVKALKAGSDEGLPRDAFACGRCGRRRLQIKRRYHLGNYIIKRWRADGTPLRVQTAGGYRGMSYEEFELTRAYNRETFDRSPFMCLHCGHIEIERVEGPEDDTAA